VIMSECEAETILYSANDSAGNSSHTHGSVATLIHIESILIHEKNDERNYLIGFVQ
jgi:hypothetical protein